MANPATNPGLILAVGASDPMGTVDVRDDTVPSFAQPRQHVLRSVDVVAPGSHVLVASGSPASYVDTLEATPAASWAPGSSGAAARPQAAAVTSGLAALLSAEVPDGDARPDQGPAHVDGDAS